MELTKRQLFELNKKYLHSGGMTCPLCEKGNACANDLPQTTEEAGVVVQICHCNECHAKWTDVYKLVKIENVVVDRVVP